MDFYKTLYWVALLYLVLKNIYFGQNRTKTRDTLHEVQHIFMMSLASSVTKVACILPYFFKQLT
jgi:hypothetical protein